MAGVGIAKRKHSKQMYKCTLEEARQYEVNYEWNAIPKDDLVPIF